MVVPDVSVVIPGSNVTQDIWRTVRTVRDQLMPPEHIEIIVANYDPLSGSEDVSQGMSLDGPLIRVLAQDDPVSPVGGRNAALDVARGTFVLFLDAGDRLLPGALTSLVDTAFTEKSDVVVGKTLSSEGERMPVGMFKETNLEFDLLGDLIFADMKSIALVRRDIIERQNLRFPSGRTSDVVRSFMAATYLSAGKVSVIADRGFCVNAFQDDGPHVSLARECSDRDLLAAFEIAYTIDEYSQSRVVRDGLVGQALEGLFFSILDRHWNALPPARQQDLASRIRNKIEDVYTDGVGKYIRPDVRVRIDFLMAGQLDELSSYIDFSESPVSQKVEWREGGFRAKLPDGLLGKIPGKDLEVSAPKVSCRLEAVSIEAGTVRISISVAIADFIGTPDLLLIRAKRRDSGQVLDFVVGKTAGEAGSENFFTEASGRLSRGVWDVYLVLHIGGFAKEMRFGSNRIGTIAPEGVSNVLENPPAGGRIMAYFTQGAGNLSIDVGAVLHKNVAAASVIGLTLDDNGRAQAIVRLTRPPESGGRVFRPP